MSESDDIDTLELVNEASVSAGRKVQFDQYEPGNEQMTLTLDFEGHDLTPEQKRLIIEDAEDRAWDLVERGIAKRHEQHMKEDAFGDE